METYSMPMTTSTMASRQKNETEVWGGCGSPEATLSQSSLPSFRSFLSTTGTSFSVSTGGASRDCSEGREWVTPVSVEAHCPFVLPSLALNAAVRPFRTVWWKTNGTSRQLWTNRINAAFSFVERGAQTSIFVFIYPDAYNSSVSLSPPQLDLSYCQ